MRTGVALAKDGDYLTGTYDTGHTSFVICAGAELITQEIKIGLASGQGEIWFNLARGIDKQTLFLNPSESDEFLEPLRILAVREYLQSFEGVAEVDGDAQFSRNDRVLTIVAPCVILDCETSNKRIELGNVNACY